MMHKPQKKIILISELKIGMIVVDKFNISLILSITEERITWINQRGAIDSCKNNKQPFARPATGDDLLVIQP